MVGAADVPYVLKRREAQHRTLAVRKFWGQNKNTTQIVLSDLRLTEHLECRKRASEVSVHPAFSNFTRKLM
jgi:hypothetical protein